MSPGDRPSENFPTQLYEVAARLSFLERFMVKRFGWLIGFWFVRPTCRALGFEDGLDQGAPDQRVFLAFAHQREKSWTAQKRGTGLRVSPSTARATNSAMMSRWPD